MALGKLGNGLLYTGVVLAWLDPLVTWASYHYIKGSSTLTAAIVVSGAFVFLLAVAFLVEWDRRRRRKSV